MTLHVSDDSEIDNFNSTHIHNLSDHQTSPGWCYVIAIIRLRSNSLLLGGGQPAGERHRGDREQEPAAAHAHHAVPEPANAEHQSAHHVPERRHRCRRQWGAGSLPRGRQERRDGWMGG